MFSWLSRARESSLSRLLHHRHTTLHRTILRELSARRRDLYLTTSITNKRQTSVPPAGFDPTVLASEQTETHDLDRVATRIGHENHTYLLTPWCRVLLEKLTGLQLVKKFPAFYGTRKFITALTSVRHISLSWASPIQSIYPHPTSWRSILILSTHLRLGLPSGFFPSGFPTKTLYAPLSSPIRATWPVHLILLDFITRTILGEEYRSLSSSLCNLLHSPVTSSLLCPNILLNTIFSNTLSFLSSLNVSDQASRENHTKYKYNLWANFRDLCGKIRWIVLLLVKTWINCGIV